MTQLAKTVIHNQVKKLADLYFGADSATKDNEHKRALSKGFALLSTMQLLDMDEDTAMDAVVDGSNDLGIDAIWIDEPQNGYFDAHIFQVKYTENLDKEKGFPENEVIKIISSLRVILRKKTFNINDALDIQLSRIKSHINEFNIPNFYVYLCNNGQGLANNAQAHIDSFLAETPENIKRYHFRYVNHVDIFQASEKAQPVNCTLEFSGGFVDEAINFKRAFVGKVLVTHIAELLNQFNDRLLGRNVRDFLGFRRAVNDGIRTTLTDAGKSRDFYFLNNGITFVCEKFDYAQGSHGARARLTHAQIINGGQTSRTIQNLINERPDLDFSQVYVLVRAYQVDMDDEGDLIHDIITATNSQNAIFARDLHANDAVQRKLETGLKHYGIRYLRRRDMRKAKAGDIRMELAAECLITVLLHRPVDAKYRKPLHFTDEFYAEAFAESRVTPELVWFATGLFKRIESLRKTSSIKSLVKQYPFIPLASHFILYLMYQDMTKINTIKPDTIQAIMTKLDDSNQFYSYYQAAVQRLAGEIKKAIDEDKREDAFTVARLLRSEIFQQSVLQ